VISLFKKKPYHGLPVDVHSHLLPGIDDGVESIEESLRILKAFHNLDYKKVITTPHVNPEFYPNTSEDILDKYHVVQAALQQENIDIELEVAAEYFLGEELMEKVTQDVPLLTFGGKYLLFECSFLNEPLFLKEFIFKAISLGYKPVLAHPERYAFVYHDFSRLEDLKNRGVLLQINANSLAGAYQKPAKKIAEKMIREQMVDLIGSDCHNFHHIQLLNKTKSSKSFQKALDLPLLNYQL
jgi:protein-tyrosine phosphatase